MISYESWAVMLIQMGYRIVLFVGRERSPQGMFPLNVLCVIIKCSNFEIVLKYCGQKLMCTH